MAGALGLRIVTWPQLAERGDRVSVVGLIRLVRPYYAVPMSLAYTLTVFYASGGGVGGRWPELWISTLSLMLMIAACYAFNEICDLDVDRSRPGRHSVATGLVSVRLGWGVTIILVIGSLGLALVVKGWAFLAGMVVIGLGLGAYDLFSKHIGLAKQLLAAALMTSIYPLAFVFSGWPAGPRAGSLMVFPVWLFITSAGYELLKDVRDRHSDPPIENWTMAIRHRPMFYRWVAGGLIAGASPLLLVCGMLGCKWVYSLGALAAIGLAIASVLSPVRQAIRLAYAECFMVVVAAATDVMVLGI